jgi:hypothetical protein
VTAKQVENWFVGRHGFALWVVGREEWGSGNGNSQWTVSIEASGDLHIGYGRTLTLAFRSGMAKAKAAMIEAEKQ